MGLGGERVDYEGLHLARPDLGPDPIEQVRVWLVAAREAGIYEPEAMTARNRRRRRPPEGALCAPARTRRARVLLLHQLPIGQGARAGGASPGRADLRLAAGPPLGARRGARRAPARGRERRLLRRAPARRAASARGRRHRARSSPRAKNSSGPSRPSSSASRTPRLPAPRTGAAFWCAPSASSCGRGARGACTIACAMSALATAGAWSASPPRFYAGGGVVAGGVVAGGVAAAVGVGEVTSVAE